MAIEPAGGLSQSEPGQDPGPVPPGPEVDLPTANPRPVVLDYNTPGKEADTEDLVWLDRLMPSLAG